MLAAPSAAVPVATRAMADDVKSIPIDEDAGGRVRDPQVARLGVMGVAVYDLDAGEHGIDRHAVSAALPLAEEVLGDDARAEQRDHLNQFGVGFSGRHAMPFDPSSPDTTCPQAAGNVNVRNFGREFWSGIFQPWRPRSFGGRTRQGGRKDGAGRSALERRTVQSSR